MIVVEGIFTYTTTNDFVIVFLRFCVASLTATGAASLASALQTCSNIEEIKYICLD